jgi:hypothetical protein
MVFEIVEIKVVSLENRSHDNRSYTFRSNSFSNPTSSNTQNKLDQSDTIQHIIIASHSHRVQGMNSISSACTGPGHGGCASRSAPVLSSHRLRLSASSAAHSLYAALAADFSRLVSKPTVSFNLFSPVCDLRRRFCCSMMPSAC